MNKLFINSRDEFISIDVKAVAYLKAAGNFTELYYIYGGGKPVQLSISITKLLDELKKYNGSLCLFVRLGRSYVVNDVMVRRIKFDGRTPLLLLADSVGHELRVDGISKNILKTYRDAKVAKIEILTKRKNDKD